MEFSRIWTWIGSSPERRRTNGSRTPRSRPKVTHLEDRTVPAGYLALGAGLGAQPLVAIRCDIINAIQGQPPNPAGGPPAPASDGTTDVTTQVFMAYNPAFRGGVAVASGNFDGDPNTPDQLVTAAGPSGGPHVIIWDMTQATDGRITVLRKRAEFMAYDLRFRGGLNIAVGDLDGDGRAELITAPQGQGGPHVKIWRFDANSNTFTLANQFMAFETTFTGGVNLASGQGYRTPFQVRQVLSQQLPANASQIPGSNFDVVPYFPPSSAPGANLGIPLVSGAFFLGSGSNTPDTANPPLNLPYFTVAGGTYQFGGANLLNSLGNITYTPNVVDPFGNHDVPPEQPLVMASWGANDPNRPTWAQPDVNYGPFVQTSPAVNGAPPIVRRFQAPPDQPNARNQLVITPGIGGGPIVRVYDFVANGAALQQNGFNQFNAFADNPTLANSRTGLKVAIGNVIENPISRRDGAGNPVIISNVTTPSLGDAGTQFPYSTNYYRQGTAQIIVSQASGGHLSRIFADFNPINPFTGAPSLRTSITQLRMLPVTIGTTTVFDPGNPLGNFQSVVNFNTFEQGIDPQFVGTMFAGVSHLPLTLTRNADGTTFTVSGDRGANIFGAGQTMAGPNRGPRVRIFDHMGPNVTFVSDGFNPDGLPLPPTSPIFAGGPTPYLNPIDDFQAFSGNAGLFGLGGMSFGFGAMPTPTIAVVELPPIMVMMVSNPFLAPNGN